MAYKFQLGAAKLGGKVTAAGLDAGDADIDNVADIAVASISADGSDITVVATDNREAAFQVSSSAAGPILFVDTSTGTESAFAPKGLAVDMDGEVKVRSNSGRMELHVSGAAYALVELGDLQIDVNQKIRISGSQPLEFADANHKLVKNASTMELHAAGAKRLTAKNGGVDVEGALHADTLDIANPSSLAGAALQRNGTTLDVAVDGSSLEIDSDALQVKALGIATGMLADDAVTYAKMQNVSATNRILGRDTAGAGAVEEISPSALRTMINVEDGSTADQTAVEIIGLLNSDLGGNFQIGNQANDSLTLAGGLTVNGTASIAGDLIVQGTTVTLDVATVGITGSFSFEGATADDFETVLGVIDPTADRALNLPNIDGNIGAFSNASWQTARSAVTVGELDLVGASAGSSVALANGDGFLMFDADDSNNTKKALLSDIATFVGNTGRLKPGANVIVASNVTISNEVTLVDTDAARTLTMPDITDADVGKVYVIKDIKGAGAGTNAISVARSSSGHQIDGTNGLTLESDRVAISLLACKDGSTFFYSIY